MCNHMKENWENFKGTLSDITMMSKREFLLTMAVCLLGGMVFGMFFSPRKSTVFGSNNGNNSGNISKNDCDADEEWEGEEA